MVIKECATKDWDAFVDFSKEGTVFHKSFFLESYLRDVTYLMCWKGQEPIAGLGFIHEGRIMMGIPGAYWGGIIFKNLETFNNYRRNETVFEALETFAGYLFDHYEDVDFSNHWNVQDMRPFDWLHYHDRAKGFYQISVRYAFLSDISQVEDFKGNLNRAFRDQSGQYQTREVADLGVMEAFDNDNAAELWQENRHALIRVMDRLMKAKSGKLVVTFLGERPAAMTFFAFDQYRAYQFLNKMDLSLSPADLIHAYESSLLLRQQMGLQEVCSLKPDRGAITPYFHIHKTKGTAHVL